MEQGNKLRYICVTKQKNMPYLIETYGFSIDGSKLLLKDIDTQNIYDSKEAATAAISVKLAEAVNNVKALQKVTRAK